MPSTRAEGSDDSEQRNSVGAKRSPMGTTCHYRILDFCKHDEDHRTLSGRGLLPGRQAVPLSGVYWDVHCGGSSPLMPVPLPGHPLVVPPSCQVIFYSISHASPQNESSFVRCNAGLLFPIEDLLVDLWEDTWNLYSSESALVQSHQQGRVGRKGVQRAGSLSSTGIKIVSGIREHSLRCLCEMGKSGQQHGQLLSWPTMWLGLWQVPVALSTEINANLPHQSGDLVQGG